MLPLFSAVVDPAWAVPATALQAAATAGLVWGMRPLLWPIGWAEAERALPISRLDRLASDAVVVALSLVPVATLYAIGAQALMASDPDWLHAFWARAVLALSGALVAAAALGVGLLQALRLPQRQLSWRRCWLEGRDRLHHHRRESGARWHHLRRRRLRASSVRGMASARPPEGGTYAAFEPAALADVSKRIERVPGARRARRCRCERRRSAARAIG